ncbi:MAG: hypothetical protein ABR600_10525 [Actinomycetota bacterium]
MTGIRIWLTAGALVVLTLGASACDLAPAARQANTDVQAAQKAEDLQVQVDLRNALNTARTFYSEAATYTGIAPASLATIEPAACYVSSLASSSPTGHGCEAGQGSPSLSVLGEGSAFAAAAMGPTGTCYWIRDVIGQGTFYGSGSPCTGTAALAASGPSF